MDRKIKKEVEDKIQEILDEGIQPNNLDALDKLVDIHKDIEEECYWKEKLDMRRYRGDYGNDYRPEYGARGRDSRGRYTARGRGGYRGEDMLDEMAENYETYMEGGTYGGPETDKAFDYMLKAAEDFMMHLFEESDSPEKEEKIRKTARRISEMRM